MLDVKEFNQSNGTSSNRPVIGYGYREYRIKKANPTEDEVKTIGSLKAKPFADTERVVDFIVESKDGDLRYISFRVKLERLSTIAWVSGDKNHIVKRAPTSKDEVLIKGEVALQFFIRTVGHVRATSSLKLDMSLIAKNKFDEVNQFADSVANNYFYLLSYQSKTEKKTDSETEKKTDSVSKTYINEELVAVAYWQPDNERMTKEIERIIGYTKSKEIKYVVCEYKKGNLFKAAETPKAEATNAPVNQDIQAQQGDDDLPF